MKLSVSGDLPEQAGATFVPDARNGDTDMAGIFADLLAMDAVAQKAGCGLKPELRAAMEANLRFPVKAASPTPQAEDMAGSLPHNVVRLGAAGTSSYRRKEA
jgi:hypothetical protein